MITKDISISRPRVTKNKFLELSGKLWFITAVMGQFIFAFYIATFYGTSAAAADFDKWNEVLPHGYSAGDTMGNLGLAIHLLFAVIITVGGPLQFIPGIRKKFPSFHRWNGRVFVLTALIMSFSGLYLSFSGRDLVGDIFQHVGLIIGAFLIIIFSGLTYRTAVSRNFKKHGNWAFRLFLIVNGVWFFRVGLMFWLILHGGPVGFDAETFQGPFLTFLSFAVSAGGLTLGIHELFLLAKKQLNPIWKNVMAVTLTLFTLITGIGIFAATMGMWLPRVGI